MDPTQYATGGPLSATAEPVEILPEGGYLFVGGIPPAIARALGDTVRANAAAPRRSSDPFARSLARLRAAVDHPRVPRSGSLVEVNSGDLAALLFHFDRVDAELRARAGQ
jgi:hypothetical protein